MAENKDKTPVPTARGAGDTLVWLVAWAAAFSTLDVDAAIGCADKVLAAFQARTPKNETSH